MRHIFNELRREMRSQPLYVQYGNRNSICKCLLLFFKSFGFWRKRFVELVKSIWQQLYIVRQRQMERMAEFMNKDEYPVMYFDIIWMKGKYYRLLIAAEYGALRIVYGM